MGAGELLITAFNFSTKDAVVNPADHLLTFLRCRVAELEFVAGKTGNTAASIFPAVGICADVEQSDGRIGDDFVTAHAGPLAKGKIVGQVPPAFAVGADEGGII